MNEPIEPIAGGISSVAQLFLSQSNQNGGSRKRRPPKTNNVDSTVDLNDVVTHSETTVNPTITQSIEETSPPKIIKPEANCPGMSIFYDHVSDPLARLETFANQTAYHNGQIAFCHIAQEIITLTCVNSEFDDNVITPIDTQIYDHFSDLEKFGYHLQRLTQSSQALLLSIEASLQNNLNGVLTKSRDLIVFTGSTPDDIIKTYQVLKWLTTLYHKNQGDFPMVAIYVCDCHDNEEALRLYGRLKLTTSKFLNIPLAYHGCNESLDATITHTELCRISYSDKIISMLQDAINPEIKQLDNRTNLQTEEAPNIEAPAGLNIQELTDDLSPKNDEQFTSNISPKYDTAPVPNAQTTSMLIEHFPKTDLALNQILKARLSNWCTSLTQPLHLSANLSKDIAFYHRTLIIVDADGRLHGTIASLEQADALLCEALVLHKWLEDHTSFVQGTFRQLRINTTLKPGIIIITAENKDHLAVASRQITQLPIKILQLQYQETNKQKSIIIS